MKISLSILFAFTVACTLCVIVFGGTAYYLIDSGLVSFSDQSTTAPEPTPTPRPDEADAAAAIESEGSDPGAAKQQILMGLVTDAGLSTSQTTFARAFANSLMTVPANAFQVSRTNSGADVIFCDGDLTVSSNDPGLSRIDRATLVITGLKKPTANYTYSGVTKFPLLGEIKQWYEFDGGVMGCGRFVKLGNLVGGFLAEDLFGPIGTTYTINNSQGQAETYTNITISVPEVSEADFAAARENLKAQLTALGATNFQTAADSNSLTFTVSATPELEKFLGDCQVSKTCLVSRNETTISITPLIAQGNPTITMHLRVGLEFTQAMSGSNKYQKVQTSRSWWNWDDREMETKITNGAIEKASYAMLMQPDASGIRPLESIKTEFERLLTSTSGDPNDPSFYDLIHSERWQNIWNQAAIDAGFSGVANIVVVPVYPNGQWVYLDSARSEQPISFITDVCNPKLRLTEDLSYIKSLQDPDSQGMTGFQADWLWNDMVQAGCFTTNLK